MKHIRSQTQCFSSGDDLYRLSYGITHSHFYCASASEQNREGRERRGEEMRHKDVKRDAEQKAEETNKLLKDKVLKLSALDLTRKPSLYLICG